MFTKNARAQTSWVTFACLISSQVIYSNFVMVSILRFPPTYLGRGRPPTRQRGANRLSLAMADLAADRVGPTSCWISAGRVRTAHGVHKVRVEPDRNTGRTTCTLDDIPVGMARLDPPCGLHRSPCTGRPAARWLFVAPCCGRRVERLFMVSPKAWQCRHCARVAYETESRAADTRAAIAVAKASAQPERRKGEKLVRYTRRQARAAKARAVLDSLSRLPMI